MVRFVRVLFLNFLIRLTTDLFVLNDFPLFSFKTQYNRNLGTK